MKQIVISTSQLKKINEELTVRGDTGNNANAESYAMKLKSGEMQRDIQNGRKYSTDVQAFVSSDKTTDGMPVIDKNIEKGQQITFSPEEKQAIADGSPVLAHGDGFGGTSESVSFSKKSIEEARLRKIRNDGTVMTKSELKESFFQEDAGNSNRFFSKTDTLKTNRIVNISKDRNNKYGSELKYYSNDGYSVRILTTGKIISSLMPNGKAGTSMTKGEYFGGKRPMDFDEIDIRKIVVGNIPEKLLVADSSVAKTISRFIKYLADNISYLSSIDETIKHPMAWMCRNEVKSHDAVSGPNFLREWEEKPNDDMNQWNEEFEMFMDGLKRGNYIEDGDTVHVEIFKGRTSSNDPRYVSYRKGSDVLQDDHFYLQHSPYLSIEQLKDIYFELGWDSSDLDYKYGEELYENKHKIKIKKKNKGKFNATKKRTGKSTEELTHSKNPITKKRAIFAQNAKKWKKRVN